MIHIVFGTPKTGTTSVHKLLLSQKKYPIFYTHDMKKISVIDYKFNTLEWQLSYIGKKKRYVDVGINLVEYCIDVYNQKQLITILQQYELKIIRTYRHPIDRRISQIFHTLNYENVLEKCGKHDIYSVNPYYIPCKILKYAVEEIQKNKQLLSYEHIDHIIEEWFSDELPYEYINYIKLYEEMFKDHPNIKCFDLVLDKFNPRELMAFLGFPLNIVFPKERDMMKRQYIINHPVLEIKHYIKNYMYNHPKLIKMMTHPILKELNLLE
jgi:hypothetical protein